MASISWATATPQDREKRLSAIADLEQQLQQRRGGTTTTHSANVKSATISSSSSSSTSGKHFILLVSKNSSIWQQRVNQDRAETMLSRFPHWIMDGSNVALVNKRNELFAISKEQGKYPQLFLVDNGVTTFIGGFELMEYYNEQGGLDALLKDSKSSKKNNITSAVKGLVKKTKVKKDKATTKAAGQAAGSEIPSTSIKSVSDMSGSGEMSVIKAASQGRLVTERSDGNMPLAEEKLSQAERIPRNSSRKASEPKRSSSKTRTDDKKSSTRSRSRGKYKASEGEGGEEDTKTRARSSSRSTKRSSSVGRLRESRKTLETDESSTKTRTRSSSRGRLRDSIKSMTPDEATTSSRRSRSRVARSRSRGRDGGRGSSRSRSRARGENEEGSTGKRECDIKAAMESTRARSVSRSRRSTRTSLKTMDASEHSMENMKDRKLKKNVADSDPPVTDSIKSPRRGTRLRDQEGEQKRVSRRDTRSASPRRDRVRSASPGTYRGDVARKREAVKEFRERKNTKQSEDDGSVRRRKSSSFGLAVPDSPRRVLGGSTHGVEKRVLGSSSHGVDKSFDKDESLHELVKRLRDKEKDRNGEIEEDQKTVELPYVQW